MRSEGKIGASTHTSMKTTLLVTLILFWGAFGAAQNAVQEDKQTPRIEVKISPLINKIAVDGTLRLRVEIWNVGKQDVFICKKFSGTVFEFCELRFTFDPSSQSKGSASAGTCLSCGHEDFLPALIRDWVSIPTQHFYGSIVELTPSKYPELTKPGHYTIRGRFSSDGLLGEQYYNSLTRFPKEIAALPATSFQGEVNTNSIEIDVVGGRR
jgi:hypothetical protein